MAGEEQPHVVQPQVMLSEALPENFTFVMNVRHLQDDPAYTLAPGYQLRRATAEEIAIIKETAQRLAGAPQLHYTYLWEHRWPHRGGTIEVLPEAEWRYFVIAFRGSNAMIVDLEAASDLAPLELEIGFTTLYSPFGSRPASGVIFNAGRLFHVLEDARYSDTFFVDVPRAAVEAIAALCARLQQHGPRLIDVRRLATQISQLKGLPHRSPLRFLGYFAILESLLTHAPKPSDPYDSITRQVKKKLTLLNNRWTPQVDYSAFGETAPETIWSKMYAYRSVLAHGGTAEFAGELAALRSHGLALQLVKETVKAAIRQALAEPQLLLDLREC